jgi:hypothetical protein
VQAVEDVAGHHIPHGSPDINVDNLQRDTYSDHGLLGGIQIGIGRHCRPISIASSASAHRSTVAPGFSQPREARTVSLVR